MTDLSTAERNARAALARDPKECVAITAEEACALFDRVRELEVERDRAEFHAARAERVAADLKERKRDLDSENTALVEQLLTQAAGRDIDVRFAASAQAGAEWQARRAEAAECRVADRDAALDACQKRIAALLTRRDELLALVAKLSQTAPLACELEGWENQRAAMLAEIGTLRARIADLQRHYNEARENAPRALTDALADIARIAGERDQARRQVATLQATVIGLLAVRTLAVRTLEPAHAEVLRDMLSHERANRGAARHAQIRHLHDERIAVLCAVLGEEPSDA